MKRMAIAAAWVWIALAQPASARAPASSELVAGAASRGVMPAMCGDAIANFVRAPRTGNLADVSALPLDDTDSPVAWCLTPDDPRCAPRDASSLPDPRSAPTPLSASVSLQPDSPRGEQISVPRALPLGAARSGSQGRVERPPRDQ
jgi:hypothetical protein